MPAPVTVQCPHCQTKLRMKDRSALGRKARCPSCSEIFTARASKPAAPARRAAPADDFDDYEDDYGDDYEDDYGDDFGSSSYDDDYGDDDWDDEPAPRSRSRSSSKSRSGKSSKSKKKKKKASWTAPLLIGISSVVGLGTVVGLGFLVMSFFGGNAIDLTYMPENVEGVIRIEVGKLTKSAMLSDLISSDEAKQALAMMKEQTSIDLNQIESITVGMTNLQSGSQAGGGEPKVLVVVRSSADLHPETIMGSQAFTTKADHKGTEYWNSAEAAVWFASARVAVVGPQAEVTAAIDRGAKEPRRKEFDFVNNDHHVLLAIAPRNVRSSLGSRPGGDPVSQLANTLDKNVKALAVGLTVTDEINAEVDVQCFDSEKAASLKKEIDLQVTQMKAHVSQLANAAPPGFEGIVNLGKAITDSVNVKQSGAEVVMTAKVPASAKQTLKDLPNMLGGAMLAGAMGGGLDFGGGGAGPPAGFGQVPGGPPGGGFPGGVPGGGGPGGGFPSEVPGRTNPGFPGGGPGGGNPLMDARTRAKLLQSTNNLKQIGLALHNYHDANRSFPASGMKDASGQSLLGWRVQILPYLGHRDLYNKFNHGEPWNSPHNEQVRLSENMPRQFSNPLNPSAGVTTYVMVQGPGSAFENNRAPKMAQITDGSSNTILVIETRASIPWTMPDNWEYRPDKPDQGLQNGYGDQTPALFADGAAIPVTRSDTNNLKGLFTASGGESVQPR